MLPKEPAIVHLIDSVGKRSPRFKQPRWKVLEHEFPISCKLPAVLKDYFMRFLPHICYHQAL